MNILSLDTLHEAPAAPGIYAWYYQARLGEADIAEAIDDLARDSDARSRRERVRTLLVDALRAYDPTDYQVDLHGPLKQAYSGSVAPMGQLSGDYLDRLVAEPQKLYQLAKELSLLAPDFASPLYIGKASNLHTRLEQHRRDIIDGPAGTTALSGPAEAAMRKFAERVKQRGIVPERLVVSLRLTKSDLDPEDVEYLLNRLTYPILGMR